MTMKLAALKHEDDYDSKKKKAKWLVDQYRPTEELSSSGLQIEALDQNEFFQAIEPPGLENYCRKISLPLTISRPDYSFFIKFHDMDFLNSSMPLVIAATADFAMSSGLAGALNREISNSDFLFSQWKNVGEVVMTPRFGNRSHRRTYYMCSEQSPPGNVFGVCESETSMRHGYTNCIIRPTEESWGRMV